MLSPDHIKKFQAIYHARFGREISTAEAEEKGTRLIRTIELLYKPMSEAEYKQLQERRRKTSGLINQDTE